MVLYWADVLSTSIRALCVRAENVLSDETVWMYCLHTGQAAIENVLNNRRTRIKNARYSVFDCHLSRIGRQMALEIPVSNDFYLEGIHKNSCLEKCWKSLKSLQKSLNSTIYCRT